MSAICLNNPRSLIMLNYQTTAKNVSGTQTVLRHKLARQFARGSQKNKHLNLIPVINVPFVAKVSFNITSIVRSGEREIEGERCLCVSVWMSVCVSVCVCVCVSVVV